MNSTSYTIINKRLQAIAMTITILIYEIVIKSIVQNKKFSLIIVMRTKNYWQ